MKIPELKRKSKNTSNFKYKISFIRDLILNSVDKGIINKIYLFGSYAYGKPRKNSDIDLCVLIEENFDRRKIALDIKINLSNNNIVPNDLLVYNISTFEQSSQERGIQKTIKEKGKLLYGL